MRNHLKKTHDRQDFGMRPSLTALRHHGRPGDPLKLQLGTSGAQRADEARREIISRGLTGHDDDPFGHGGTGRRLADQAAGNPRQKIDQQTQFRLGLHQGLQLLGGFGQFQT